MSGSRARLAGAAISWQAAQHFGVKVIYLARVLILARLLLPEDFGLLAIAAITVQVLMNLTEVGMVPALVQRAEVSRRHYDAAWTVGMLRALAVSLVVFFGAPLIAEIFAEPRATAVIRVLAVRPMLEAAASIKVADLTRRLQFRELAFLRLLEAIATTVVSLVLAPSFGVWALVAGSLAGPALYSSMSYVWARHRPRIYLQRDVVATLVRFGRWIFLSSIIAVAGRSILHLAISRRLGVTELGLYFLAAKLAFLPSSAATDIVGSVAFPVYSRIQHDAQQAVAAFRTHILSLCVLLLPVYGLVLALAPTLTEEVLGPRWIGAAPVIRILAIASLIGVLGDIAAPILKGFGRPAQVTVLEAVQTVLLIGFVWDLAGRFGLPGAAAAWLPALFVSQIISVVFLRRALGSLFKGLLRPILVVTVVSALGSWVAVRVDAALSGLASLVLASLASAAFVGLSLLLADRRLNLGFGIVLARAFPRLAALCGYALPEGEIAWPRQS